jgi:hypothetical protein
VHALQQEKNGLQAEIQSLQTKTREHIGSKERLEKTLVQVTSRLKVSCDKSCDKKMVGMGEPKRHLMSIFRMLTGSALSLIPS